MDSNVPQQETVASWDVGISHLAPCVLKMNGEIYQLWDNIDLLSHLRHRCSGVLKSGKECKSLAKFFITNPSGETRYFCKTHSSQSEEHWSPERTRELCGIFSGATIGGCQFSKRNGELCGKNAKISINEIPYCTTHHKSTLNKLVKEYGLQNYNQPSSKLMNIHEVKTLLIRKLDEMLPLFIQLNVKHWVIENQPVKTNATMKTVASTLYDWAMFRGQIDHQLGWHVDHICFMNAGNKIKLDEEKAKKVAQLKGGSKYDLTKSSGVEITRVRLAGTSWIDVLDSFAKKDDPCDAYLQGIWYLHKLGHIDI